MEHDETATRGPMCRIRIPEAELLARPDLWTRDGLEEYLRERGIDPSQPYGEDDGSDPAAWLYWQGDGRGPLAEAA